MNARVKHTMLGLALILTIIFVWYAPTVSDEGVALSDRVKDATMPPRDTAGKTKNLTSKSNATAATSTSAAVLSIQSRSQSDETDLQDLRLFTSTQWTTPVLQKSVVPKIRTVDEASANQAPPALPFVVLGRYIEAGQEVIFLQHNNQNLVVRVGDTLLEQYKVESLQGTTLNLRYLPLNLAQSLEIGSKQ
jgi:hypothetical protein